MILLYSLVNFDYMKASKTKNTKIIIVSLRFFKVKATLSRY